MRSMRERDSGKLNSKLSGKRLNAWLLLLILCCYYCCCCGCYRFPFIKMPIAAAAAATNRNSPQVKMPKAKFEYPQRHSHSHSHSRTLICVFTLAAYVFETESKQYLVNIKLLPLLPASSPAPPPPPPPHYCLFMPAVLWGNSGRGGGSGLAYSLELMMIGSLTECDCKKGL